MSDVIIAPTWNYKRPIEQPVKVPLQDAAILNDKPAQLVPITAQKGNPDLRVPHAHDLTTIHIGNKSMDDRSREQWTQDNIQRTVQCSYPDMVTPNEKFMSLNKPSI